MIAVISLGLGVAAGSLAGGRIRHLAAIRLKHELVLVTAFIVQGFARGRLIGVSASSWGMRVWILLSVLLVVVLISNAKLPGVRVMAAGVTLNLAVVVANMGMPVAASLESAGQAIRQSFGFYQLAGTATIGAWAGDSILLGVAGQQFLVSSGDILLMVGVASLVASAMLGEQGTIAPLVDSLDEVADLHS